jgi:glucokinase
LAVKSTRGEATGGWEAVVLDIGGTKLAAGVVDESGRLRERRTAATEGARGAQRALERALGLVDDVIAAVRQAGGRPRALGVSTNGLTRETGVELAPAVPGWSELRIPAALRKRFPGLPTTVINDVKAGARAELAWGALQGVSNGLYVNLGTGFAAALVVDGRVLEGAHGAAGEAGYIVPSLEELARHTPGRATLEERIGGRGVPAWASAELGRALSAAELFELSGRDARARELYDELASEIGLWIANLAVVIDPSRVVLGGGMARDEGLLRRRAEETVNRIAPFGVEVVDARFGAESALIGAGAAAFSDELG